MFGIFMLHTRDRHKRASHACSTYTCSTSMFDIYMLHTHGGHIHALHAWSTDMHASIVTITSHASIASDVCSHRSHHMYARIDRNDNITCIDRITCMLTSITSLIRRPLPMRATTSRHAIESLRRAPRPLLLVTMLLPKVSSSSTVTTT